MRHDNPLDQFRPKSRLRRAAETAGWITLCVTGIIAGSLVLLLMLQGLVRTIQIKIELDDLRQEVAQCRAAKRSPDR